VPNAETDNEKEPRNPEGVEAPHTWGSSQCDAASVFRLRRCFDPATCGNSSISLCLIATHGGNTCSVLLCGKSIRRCELRSTQFNGCFNCRKACWSIHD
jgi:hypothetical protein